jgi:outer membrane receptor protein involved in Fe transport
VTNTKGILESPDQAGVLDLTYRYQGWRFRYGLEWIGSMSSYKYFEEDPATSVYKMDTPSYMLHSTSVEYTGNKWSIIAGVRNLADKEPPSISSGFADRVGNTLLYSGFDYFGRTYFVNAQFTF